MKYLNAGCGTHYAQGWVNTDVWETDTTRPDVRVKPGKPYPFEDNTFDAVFLGHVLEHIKWDEVLDFLKDMQRIAKPGAPFLAVGPDVMRTLVLWKNNQMPDWLVESVMEHADMNFQPGREHEWWDGAHHHWNCHEKRVIKLLEGAGFTNISNVFDIIPNNAGGTTWQDPNNGIVWPVVGKQAWQFCLRFDNIA